VFEGFEQEISPDALVDELKSIVNRDDENAESFKEQSRVSVGNNV
jgi:hypothetical protein